VVVSDSRPGQEALLAISAGDAVELTFPPFLGDYLRDFLLVAEIFTICNLISRYRTI
jgi:hypothetical protein